MQVLKTLILFLFSLFLAEFIYKQILGFDPSFYELHPRLGWTYNKSRALYHQDRIFLHFNGLGFRDHDVQIAKKGMRVFLLGDGKTSALHLKSALTFPYILQEKLGLDLMNLAVDDWCLDNMVNAYKEYAKEYRPDYLLFVLTSDSLRCHFKNNNILSNEDKLIWSLKTHSAIANSFLADKKIRKKYIAKNAESFSHISNFKNFINDLAFDQSKIIFTFLPDFKSHLMGEAEIHNFLKSKYPKNYINVFDTFFQLEKPKLIFDKKTGHYTEKAHNIIKNRIHLYFRYLDYVKVPQNLKANKEASQ